MHTHPAADILGAIFFERGGWDLARRVSFGTAYVEVGSATLVG
jgi:hypothetical protein